MDKKNCFIIMPFSGTTKQRTEDYWTEHFENFLKPSIERENVMVERSSPVRGDIITDIIFKLINADIVIADLTDANPNVYWELGVRQSFKHGTITIAEFGTKLPFDISGKGTLFYYPKDHIKNSKFGRNLNKAIDDCIKNPDRPDSRILEVMTGRGSFYEIINKEEMLRRVQGLISEIGYNLKNYESILKRAKKNQGEGLKTFTTSFFRLSSSELLLATRYISSNDSLYKHCEDYYDHLTAINGRIQMWPTRDNSVEKWLIAIMDKEAKIVPFLKELKVILQVRN